LKKIQKSSLTVFCIVILITLIGFILQFKIPFYRYAPERFESIIEQFEQDEKLKPSLPNSVLFYGSSSIRLWSESIQQDFPNSNVVVRGFGGSMMHDLLFYFDRIVLPVKPDFLFIYAGENDVSGHIWPNTILNKFTELLEKVESELPNTKVYFISIKPSPHRWFIREEQQQINQLIRELAEHSKKLTYIDIGPSMLNLNQKPDLQLFQPDGIHMSALGYDRWTKVIKPILKEDINKTSESE